MWGTRTYPRFLIKLAAPMLAASLGSPAVARDIPTPPPRPATETPADKAGAAQKPDIPLRTGAGEAYGPSLPLPPVAAPAPVALTGEICRAKLKEMGASFKEADVPKASSSECVVVDAVRLEGVAVPLKAGVDFVKLSAPPPLIACDAAVAVTDWIQDSVAPLARGHFAEALDELQVGGGFECRQRNHQTKAPRSEHSYGRALDVMAFKIGNRVIKVQKTPPEDAKPFLDAVWASGCGRFSTALGPDADSFHENHIHVDLQPRRSASSKFCE